MERDAGETEGFLNPHKLISCCPSFVLTFTASWSSQRCFYTHFRVSPSTHTCSKSNQVSLPPPRLSKSKTPSSLAWIASVNSYIQFFKEQQDQYFKMPDLVKTSVITPITSYPIYNEIENCLPGSSAGKESVCNVGDLGSITGLGRCPGEGHGSPFQCSCLENPCGQRSLAGHGPRGCKELDMTEWLSMHTYLKLTQRCKSTIVQYRFKKMETLCPGLQAHPQSDIFSFSLISSVATFYLIYYALQHIRLLAIPGTSEFLTRGLGSFCSRCLVYYSLRFSYSLSLNSHLFVVVVQSLSRVWLFEAPW